MNFNPYSRSHLGNPHPVYAQLREERPVHLNERPRFWTISRFAHIQQALRDWSAFSSGAGITLDGFTGIKPMIILMDPPRQATLRKVMLSAFASKRIALLENSIRQTTRYLLDVADAESEIDLVAEFTAPLPIMVIADMLGIDPADRDLFKSWSNGIMATAAGDYASLQDNYQQIFAYFGDVIEARRKAPRDDLITALVHASVDGAMLTDDEILGFCALLLIAGNETTTNLLGNAALLLGKHHTARAQIVSDRSLLPGALEEVLRFEGPVPTLTRTTTRDVEIHGQVIPAGQKVLLLLAAANRDPRVFGEPEHFDIHRRGLNHIEFGSGIHYCMGASLARLEAKVAFEELLGRFPQYAVATTGLAYFNTPSIRGPVKLPVVLNG
ncbi:cytochrome P450 [Mycobacterium sp.]|uniref:cytochrome P450 n=1 Tax=Mycobacterium sp. TaxID=1785 RepID=UPI003D11F2EB